MNEHLYKTVIKWIPANKRVLDLGAGDGTFLHQLIQTKSVHAEAVEKNPELATRCIDNGLVVYQGDLLDGLDQYSARSFDYVLLLGTFQELLSPEEVLHAAFRVAERIVLAFTNFAWWGARLQLMLQGVSPAIGGGLPWYEDPNIQFFSSIDFNNFCRAKKIRRVQSAYFNNSGALNSFPNLRAKEVLTILEWNKNALK